MSDRYRLFNSFEIISSRRKVKRDTAFVFSDLLSASIADYTLHPRVGVIMLSLPSRNLHALCPRRLARNGLLPALSVLAIMTKFICNNAHAETYNAPCITLRENTRRDKNRYIVLSTLNKFPGEQQLY